MRKYINLYLYYNLQLSFVSVVHKHLSDEALHVNILKAMKHADIQTYMYMVREFFFSACTTDQIIYLLEKHHSGITAVIMFYFVTSIKNLSSVDELVHLNFKRYRLQQQICLLSKRNQIRLLRVVH